MDEKIIEFLLECPNCGAQYLVDIPEEDIDPEGELAPVECEECGSDIDAQAAFDVAMKRSSTEYVD